MKSFLKIPQKVHHALLIVADLATQYDSGSPISLSAIAAQSGLSQGFLEEIAAPLRDAGIIKGRRGAKGGYVLTTDPADITVGDVIMAIDGPIALVDCFDDAVGCSLESLCATQNVWYRVQRQITSTLAGMTIRDIIEAPHKVRTSSLT